MRFTILHEHLGGISFYLQFKIVKERVLYSVNETENALIHVRNAYYTIRDRSVANYEYLFVKDTQIEKKIKKPVELIVLQHNNQTVLAQELGARKMQLKRSKLDISPSSSSVYHYKVSHIKQLQKDKHLQSSYGSNSAKKDHLKAKSFFTPTVNSALTFITKANYSKTSTKRQVFYLGPEDKGPFDNFHTHEEKLNFIHSMISMKFLIELRDHDYEPQSYGCLDWKIEIMMEMIQKSYIRMRVLDGSIHKCVNKHVIQALTDRYLWLNIFNTLLSCIYLVLNCKGIFRSIMLYQRAKKSLQSNNHISKESISKVLLWNELPFDVRRRFFNYMFFSTSLALIFTITNSIWSIWCMMSFLPVSSMHRFVKAMGCMLLWCSFVGYLEHHNRFFSLILTIRYGMPRVIRFLVGVLPILIGYACFGLIYFGEHTKSFGKFSTSMYTLFSIMNGDEIRSTFEELKSVYPHLGQIYMYSFIVLFMYVVTNVFIAIIEEAFFATKSNRRVLEYLMEREYAFEHSEPSLTRKRNEKIIRTFNQLLILLDTEVFDESKDEEAQSNSIDSN